MIELIKKILNNNNTIIILQILSSLFVAFITAILTSMRLKKQLYIESFKKEGIAIQKKILEFWSTAILISPDEALNKYNENVQLNDKKKLIDTSQNINIIKETINEIHKETFMYGSKSTIKALGTYQQFSYKNQKNVPKSKKRQMEMLIKTARVTIKLKYDFTGEKINTMDILKIKITDLDIEYICWGYYWIIMCFIKENVPFGNFIENSTN